MFETYWASEPVVPAQRFDGHLAASDLNDVRAQIRRRATALADRMPNESADDATWRDGVASGAHTIEDGAIRVTADTPGTWDRDDPTQVSAALHQAVDSAQHDVVAVTPFFVPTEHDVAWYARLVARGVHVRLLTNSLASNSGTISNSGLDKQRTAVVEAGVELHELRADAAIKPDWETEPWRGRYLGLHAKLYTIDRERVFLGSINLDPRSKVINTEIGMLVADAAFARQTSTSIEQLMTPQNCWRVDLDPERRLTWTDDHRRTRRQPARNAGQRIVDQLYRLLPLDPYI